MSSKTLNISLPNEVIKKIDLLAKKNYTSRSDIIRQALLRELRAQEQNRLDAEGQWETVVDFSELPGGGLPAQELVARLKNLNGSD